MHRGEVRNRPDNTATVPVGSRFEFAHDLRELRVSARGVNDLAFRAVGTDTCTVTNHSAIGIGTRVAVGVVVRVEPRQRRREQTQRFACACRTFQQCIFALRMRRRVKRANKRGCDFFEETHVLQRFDHFFHVYLLHFVRLKWKFDLDAAHIVSRHRHNNSTLCFETKIQSFRLLLFDSLLK